MLQPSVALGIAVLTGACSGCGDPAGEIGVNGTRTGRVAAHEWLCAVEFAGTDTFVAHLTPCFLSLELREGGCHADGAVLGSSSTGTLIVALRRNSMATMSRSETPLTNQSSTRSGCRTRASVSTRIGSLPAAATPPGRLERSE